ncbi:hypothetical protein JTB14_016318 [Gonioctena quinquepunctata]|nr:hypothetical protein JTB14_016318 [Gonioctena quinquepunctata]
MLSIVGDPYGHRVHIDNYFSRYNLFEISGEIRFRASGSGIIRDKEVENSKRREFDYQFDKIKQYPNVQRWNRDEKEYSAIPQPKLIHHYNMDDVDQHYWLLEEQSIAIRGKKWYWCLITRIVDMA